MTSLQDKLPNPSRPKKMGLIISHMFVKVIEGKKLYKKLILKEIISIKMK